MSQEIDECPDLGNVSVPCRDCDNLLGQITTNRAED